MRSIRRLALLLTLAAGTVAAGSSTTITYQGQLRQAGAPFTGLVDLEFQLYDQAVGGTAVGSPQLRAGWPIEDGLFQAELDFGIGAFTEQVRWLEIRVDGTTLSPRQAVRPSPMALFALAGNEGPQGPQGDPGPQGPQGPPGDSHWILDGNATYYTAGPVGIGIETPSTNYALDVDGGILARRDSTIGFPQLYLFETQPDDFARLNFFTSGGSRLWAIAARSGGADPTTGQLNIFNGTEGDLLSVRGDGWIGMSRANPLAPLDLRARDRWHPGSGNGRGDFYLGDGDVGLSMGVSLGGGGRGVSRIWTKGGVEHLFLGSAAYGTSLAILPGQVGIANTNPGNTLDVAGGIRVRDLAHGGPASRPLGISPAGDLVLQSPPPQILAVPPTAFRPWDDGVPYRSAQSAFIETGAGGMGAPLHLPHGAEITEVRIWYEDEVAAALEFDLCEIRYSLGSCFLVASGETIGSSNAIREFVINTFGGSPDPWTVDNARGALTVFVYSTGWNGSNSRVVGMTVTYTPP